MGQFTFLVSGMPTSETLIMCLFGMSTLSTTIGGGGSSGHCTVKTGGNEKDRFTVQFCIMKNGDELIPLIIFKGEPKP